MAAGNWIMYDSAKEYIGDDELLCYCVLESSDLTATDGQTITLALNASGILTLSGATS